MLFEVIEVACGKFLWQDRRRREGSLGAEKQIKASQKEPTCIIKKTEAGRRDGSLFQQI